MELTVEKRDTNANTNELRRKGLLPAVVYGRSEESTPISVDRKVFEKLFREAGESTVITLKGLGSAKEALIHEVAFHPVSGQALHADFYAIEKGQTVTVSVPLEFEGVSSAVKDLGGVLVKVMHELEIECQPKDLPQHIVVDISKLKTLDDQIMVKDLKLPLSAKITVEADEVVALVTGAQEETEEETEEPKKKKSKSASAKATEDEKDSE